MTTMNNGKNVVTINNNGECHLVVLPIIVSVCELLIEYKTLIMSDIVVDSIGKKWYFCVRGMKRRLQSYFAVLISMIFVSTSVIQYHHHDDNGAMCLYLFHNVNVHHHAHNGCTARHSFCRHNHKHSSEDDERNCSGKLGQIIASKQLSIRNHVNNLSSQLFGFGVLPECVVAPQIVAYSERTPYILPSTQEFYHTLQRFRATPVA